MTETAQPGPEPENENPAAMAADTLGRDLLGALVDELRTVPEWEALDQAQQERTIGRLGVRVRENIRAALSILFGGTYPACVATVDSVQFKDGIKATLKLGKTEHHRHELADAEGQSVIIVMQAPETYLARMEEIKARRQQPDLFDSKTAGGYEGRMPRERPEDSPSATQVGGDEHTLETLTLDMGPLHEQAKAMLDALAAQLDPSAIIQFGLSVDAETAAKWSDEDCQRIAAWVLDVRRAMSEPGFDLVTTFVPCSVLVPLQLELETGTEEVPPGALWMQAQQAAARAGVVVTDELAQSWTEEECIEVAAWSRAEQAGERPGLPRPDCLPYADDDGATS